MVFLGEEVIFSLVYLKIKKKKKIENYYSFIKKYEDTLLL